MYNIDFTSIHADMAYYSVHEYFALYITMSYVMYMSYVIINTCNQLDRHKNTSCKHGTEVIMLIIIIIIITLLPEQIAK